MTFQKVQRILRIYTVVVLILVVAFIGAGVYYQKWAQQPHAIYMAYMMYVFAVLAALMLAVTRTFIQRMAPKEKTKNIRNK